MKMKEKTKKRVKSALSVFLIFAVLIAGAFAYLTATDSKNNVFTIGDIDIELKETNWVADGDNWIHQNGDNDSILPGIPVDKDPYVSNTGVNSAWVFVTVGIPTGLETGENEVQSYGSDINIPVSAYAVQDIYDDSADSQAIFDRFFKETALKEFGEESTEAVVELFSMDNLDTTNWIQLGEAYNSADGHMYYTFAYKDMVKPDTDTTKLFETVTLRTDLVGTSAGLLPGVLVDTQNNEYYSSNKVAEKDEYIYFGDTVPTLAGDLTKDVDYDEGDIYINPDNGFKYEFDGEKWVLIGTVNAYLSYVHNSDKNIEIFNAEVVDPQADPDPNHAAPEIGDTYEDDDYIYKYGYAYCFPESDEDLGWQTFEWAQATFTNDIEFGTITDYSTLNWGVRVKDPTKTSYGPMKSEIWGKPVDAVVFTYAWNENLTTAPIVSTNAKCITGTLMGCSSLKNPIAIPEGTTELWATFNYCTSLESMPVLPSTLTILRGTFSGCTSLTQTTAFPASLEVANTAFEDCTSLVTAPDMTQATKLVDLRQTFYNCKNLTGTVKIGTQSLIGTDKFSSIGKMFYGTVNPITFEYPNTEANNAVITELGSVPSNVTLMPY